MMTTQTDVDEVEVLMAFDQGLLRSIATRAELARMKAAARATALKDRRVNIGPRHTRTANPGKPDRD